MQTSMEVDLKERKSRLIFFRGLLLDPFYSSSISMTLFTWKTALVRSVFMLMTTITRSELEIC